MKLFHLWCLRVIWSVLYIGEHHIWQEHSTVIAMHPIIVEASSLIIHVRYKWHEFGQTVLICRKISASFNNTPWAV